MLLVCMSCNAFTSYHIGRQVIFSKVILMLHTLVILVGSCNITTLINIRFNKTVCYILVTTLLENISVLTLQLAKLICSYSTSGVHFL